jgi:hypothetical protein
MRSLRVLFLVLCVAGCASTTTQVRAPGDDWQAYRQEIMRQRDEGKLSPVEAQAKIEKKFQELYGSDPAMDGAFAYSDELLHDAEAGDLTMSEAEQLSKAHQNEALAEFKETVAQRESEESTFPPEQETSD